MKKTFKRGFLSIASGALLTIYGCGGGGGGSSPDPAATPSANKTLVNGVASKGPLNGSTVCAYAITNNIQSSALGACATNIVNGNYSIDIGNYTGSVLLEATGGTYIDEATGTTVTLASPLRSILSNVTGSKIFAAITPLTELAYQDANSVAAGLTSTRIQSAIANVQTNFGVSDIVSIQPVDALNVPAGATAEQKTYALALATVSQYQKNQPNGTSLVNSLQSIRACLFDSNSCGTDAKKVGNLLNGAMNTFQSSHTVFAGTTLPVANLGAIPTLTCVSPQVLQGGVCVSLMSEIAFNKTFLTYAPQDNFTTSPSQTVILTNTGNTGIILDANITLPAFAKWNIVNDTCVYASPKILSAGASCSVSITFAPIGQDGKRNVFSLQQQLGGNPPPIPPDEYSGVYEVWGYSVTNPQVAVPKIVVNLNGTGLYPLTCSSTQVLQGNVCVTPAPTCTSPQVLQGNVCVTPTPIPTGLDAKNCVEITYVTAAQNKDWNWDSQQIKNICNVPIYVMWCHSPSSMPGIGSSGNCGAGSNVGKFFQLFGVFKPGETNSNRYSLPPETTISYGACQGGKNPSYPSGSQDGLTGTYTCN